MTKVGLAYPMFFGPFNDYIPQLQIIRNPDDVKNFDLIVFSGGEDVNPGLYNQENKFSTYNTERDEAETKVFRMAQSLNKKVFGVCRGHQLINVLMGGSLVQDIMIEKKVYHNEYHELTFTISNSILQKFYAGHVNSLHHQGVIRTGRNLMKSTEHQGIVESCESRNIITVQWHPEFMHGQEKFFNFLVNEWADPAKNVAVEPIMKNGYLTAEEYLNTIRMGQTVKGAKFIIEMNGNIKVQYEEVC